MDALDTASVWCLGAAVALRMAGRSNAAAIPLLAAGIGYFGGVWERIAHMRLSGLRHGDYKHIDATQVLYHAAMVAWGFGLLER